MRSGLIKVKSKRQDAGSGATSGAGAVTILYQAVFPWALVAVLALTGCASSRPDIKLLESKVAASPYDPQAHQALADAYYAKSILDKHTYEQNCITKALTEYKQVLEMAPNNAAVLGRVGLIHKDLGFYSESQKYLEQALKLDFNLKPERKALAQLYYNEGVQAVTGLNYQRGLDLFNKVLRLDPGLKVTYHNLAIVHYNLASADVAAGRYEAGLAKLDKALAYDPKYAEAKQNKAVAYAKLAGQYAGEGQYEKALDYFEQSLKIKPSADTKRNMAVVYCKQAVSLQRQSDRYGEAIALYTKAIKCCPDKDDSLVKNAQNNIKALEQRMKKKK